MAVRRDMKINQSGLMRCCLQSAAEWVDEDADADVAEGETIDCRYGSGTSMVVHDGVIEWVGKES